jgi:hypothetical protein
MNLTDQLMSKLHPGEKKRERGTPLNSDLPRPSQMGRVGIEPTTVGLKDRCSTTELPAHMPLL